MTRNSDDVAVRRLLLPWRPRFRLILSYPRQWHWVVTELERVDVWFTRRIEGRALRRLWIAIAFPLFLVVRFLGLVAVLEITIIAFTASIYLVWGEWMALVLLCPFILLARLAHLLPWPLFARAGPRRWTTRITGWSTARQTLTIAHDALRAGREPPETRWTEVNHRSRIRM